jgi:hypothetical protein
MSDDVQPAKKAKTWERPPKIEDEPGEPYWEVSHWTILCSTLKFLWTSTLTVP